MKARLNHRLKSVKSLAPLYVAMRVPRSGAYDFICRCCGEPLEPEKEAFQFLHDLLRAFNPSSTVPIAVVDILDEAQLLRAHSVIRSDQWSVAHEDSTGQ